MSASTLYLTLNLVTGIRIPVGYGLPVTVFGLSRSTVVMIVSLEAAGENQAVVLKSLVYFLLESLEPTYLQYCTYYR